MTVAKRPQPPYDCFSMSGTHNIITVAAGQVEARLMNEADSTLESLGRLIAQAAQKRAELLVLPECAYPAYLLGSVDSYRAGDHLKSDRFVSWLADQARSHELHIVSGFVEDAGDALYNAAVLISDRGKLLGGARKRFLWHADHAWFSPGETIAAIDSPIGRIGIVICAEARCPEILSSLVADGAEMIAMPTCWINGSRDPGHYTNPQVEFLMEARAREFRVPIICADKSGWEQPGVGYVGQSRIYRADGSVAASASPTGETVVAARIVRRKPPRVWTSEARRPRLCSLNGAVYPAAEPPRRVTLAAVPTVVAEEQFTGGIGESLFAPLRDKGVQFAMFNIAQEAAAERLTMLAHAFDITACAFPTRADVFKLGPVHVGIVPGQWSRSFATPRALALDGAEVLLFFDMPEDIALLRTRAVENRVFLIGANERNAIIIGPDGSVLARGSAREPVSAVAQVDPADTADKNVAPETDVFAERRPSIYRF